MTPAIETDYLVIGAGAVGLAFADELAARSDAHITLVDRRDAPGGHWNDVYPFVRLHQPASFYGVNSMELARGGIDTDGPNRGFLTLSEGPEIVHYFHRVLAERLLPTGRVRFVPMSDVETEAEAVTIRHRLSGRRTPVEVRRKVVDASWHTNAVPRTHTPAFSIAPGVACAPPNDLPRRAAQFDHVAVLGAGKTAIDAVVWLLAHGAAPESITWVMPRDAWFFNRAKVQPAMPFFEELVTSLAEQREAMAVATSARDLAHRLEACGAWLRLDRSIEPTVMHYATVSEGELELLRRVARVLRRARVRALEPGRLVFDSGVERVPEATLFVDCTASALAPRPVRPIFDGARITLQMIRIPQPTFSGAFIAVLETLFEHDDDRNRYAQPIPLPDTVDDYPVSQLIDQTNRFHASRHPTLREWATRSRLDGFASLLASVDPGDAAKMALLERMRAATKAAMANLPRLAAMRSPAGRPAA